MPMDIYSIDDIMPRGVFITRADQVDIPAGSHGTLEDVMQVQFGPAPERVIDVAPVDCQNPQDRASGLRAITPMVGVV